MFGMGEVVRNISNTFTIFEMSAAKTKKINEIIRSSSSSNGVYEILI